MRDFLIDTDTASDDADADAIYDGPRRTPYPGAARLLGCRRY
jgi:hypothetical protein